MLEADLSKASGTNPTFVEEQPDRFINCGVAEADMICIAAGLAVEGKIPFCASFTPFASRRVYDQVTISVAYANTNVKIVGTAPGITAGPNGGTHMCFQDLAIMRAMPEHGRALAVRLLRASGMPAVDGGARGACLHAADPNEAAEGVR